jgi:CBS domain containing-hemolysin-like protein
MDHFIYLGIFISLLFSALFSGLEIAVVSANKLKIELESKHNVLFKALSALLKKPARVIGVMLMGNNIALVMYGIFMAQLMEPVLFSFTDSEAVVLVVQTVVSTLIVIFFAEFIPKALFGFNPNVALKVFALPVLVLYFFLIVPTMVVIGLSQALLWMFARIDFGRDESSFGRIDLDHYLRQMTSKSNTETEEIDHEIQIFQNALDFSKVKARECMVPRTEIVALEINEPVEKLKEKLIETGLSKILIYKDNIDNIIGYVHAYDLFKQPEFIKSILLPVLIIPESMPANGILQKFIKNRRSIAVVVDEFGGTSGILTIEDTMEEIFGEIEDEHDKEELIEREEGPGEYLFSARLEIDYLNEKFKLNLPVAEEYETLAGLIIQRQESIPEENEEIKFDDYTFVVTKVSDNKIEQVRLLIGDVR